MCEVLFNARTGNRIESEVLTALSTRFKKVLELIVSYSSLAGFRGVVVRI